MDSLRLFYSWEWLWFFVHNLGFGFRVKS
jgi:hypothetical protein